MVLHEYWKLITLWLDMCVCLTDAKTVIYVVANYCERERKKKGGGGGVCPAWLEKDIGC